MTSRATPRDLTPLLAPQTVAVVGVGSDPNSPGSRVFRNLLNIGKVTVYGVNPKSPVLEGQQTFESLDALPVTPDLAILATPAAAIEGLITSAAGLGVRAAAILAAGFGETGDEGQETQRRIVELARANDMLLIGPNSMGYINVADGVMASFTNAVNEPNAGGKVAVVGQSGGMAAIVYTILVSQGVGVDYLVALGNESDVSFGEVAHWLIDQDRATTVVGFVESLAAWDSVRAAAGAARDKGATIAVCRAGRSDVGARAAASHVGAIAGNDRVLSAACEDLGIVQVPSLDGLVDVAKAGSMSSPLRGRRVGVATASGGAGTLLADLLIDQGLEVPELSDTLQKQLYEIIPWFGSATNPIDTTAIVQNRPDVFADVTGALAASGEVDAVFLFLGTLDPIADALVESISAAARAHPDIPVVVAWGGGSRVYKAKMIAAGVPTYDDPGRAVTGLANLLPLAVDSTDDTSVPAAASLRRPAVESSTLNEHHVRDLLADSGLPFVAGEVVTSADAAVRVAEEVGLPVVAKLVAAGAEHKSDVGGVLVGLDSFEAVRDGCARLLQIAVDRGLTAEGVLVQAMAPADHELLCAVRRDPTVGPVVVVGLGGRQSEILAQAVVAEAPVTRAKAVAMVGELCGGRLVSHHRGLDPAAVDRIADVLVTLGHVIAANDWLEDLEVNPVRIDGSDVVICDGLATVVDA